MSEHFKEFNKKINRPVLFLFYGPNGAGKSSTSRYFATKRRSIQIEIDWFSSMQRGRVWHTRKNCRDKIHMLLGTLQAALDRTNYREFYVDGVLIYPFMFKMIDAWCHQNHVKLFCIKLYGKPDVLTERVLCRKNERKNWNNELPKIYENLTYKNSVVFDTTMKNSEALYKRIEILLNQDADD